MDRFDKGFVVVWVFGALLSLGIIGFVIWVIYTLVSWITAQSF